MMTTLEESSPWFPPEIIHEILLKATVKSLLQCKSVCKDWFSLISNPDFIKKHYTLSSTNIEHDRLVWNTCKQANDLISFPLDDVLFDKCAAADELKNPFNQSQCFMIIGSCHGLMCVFAENGKSPFKFSLNSDRIFLNGSFHWVTYEHPERIVALDLAKETYAKLLFPEYYSISQDDYRDFRLTSLGESLCLNCDS
ncbi:F-box associated domain containing protein [Tanacetum coccineum]